MERFRRRLSTILCSSTSSLRSVTSGVGGRTPLINFFFGWGSSSELEDIVICLRFPAIAFPFQAIGTPIPSSAESVTDPISSLAALLDRNLLCVAAGLLGEAFSPSSPSVTSIVSGSKGIAPTSSLLELPSSSPSGDRRGKTALRALVFVPFV